jgi:hypothetical protein
MVFSKDCTGRFYSIYKSLSESQKSEKTEGESFQEVHDSIEPFPMLSMVPEGPGVAGK